jgi:hypothetical protein
VKGLGRPSGGKSPCRLRSKAIEFEALQILKIFFNAH